MQMRTFSSIILFGVIGLIVGYLLFAKVGNRYIPVADLLQVSRGVMAAIASKLYRYNQVLQNILIAGGVGALVGLVLGLGARSRR